MTDYEPTQEPTGSGFTPEEEEIDDPDEEEDDIDDLLPADLWF